MTDCDVVVVGAGLAGLAAARHLAASGLSVAQLTQGTIVGNLGFSEIAFPKPLFHGDTLYAETVITDKRESKSRPGEGIVTFAHTGRNQHGDVVATASRKTMVRKRPA